MNWQQGFLRLWIVGALAWVAIILSLAAATDHVVLKKPDITVHWGKENIVYPGASTEEEITSDLRRRADKMNADDEKDFQNLTQEQKDFCNQNSNTNFGQLPKYCMTYALHGSVVVIPDDWKDHLRSPPRTVWQEIYYLAPRLLIPPALLLLVAWAFIWVGRGFRRH